MLTERGRRRHPSTPPSPRRSTTRRQGDDVLDDGPVDRDHLVGDQGYDVSVGPGCFDDDVHVELFEPMSRRLRRGMAVHEVRHLTRVG